jgi:hypothetical protein
MNMCILLYNWYAAASGDMTAGPLRTETESLYPFPTRTN